MEKNNNNIIELTSTKQVYNNTTFKDLKHKHDKNQYWLYLSISNSNNKMGPLVNSMSFNVIDTCSDRLPCFGPCYAHHMQNYNNQNFNSWRNNYLLYKNNREYFKLRLLIALKTSIYFRFFVGGDIPDSDFLPLVFELAPQAPQCKILIFTKKYGLTALAIKQAGGRDCIPQNVNIILSAWDGLKIYNPYALPVAVVYEKEPPQNCYICLADGKAEKDINATTCTSCALAGAGCFNCNNDSNYIVAFKKH